jgi:transposase
LEGVRVTKDVQLPLPGTPLVVDVGLRAPTYLRCPWCGFKTKRRYDDRTVDSVWRHLDLGGRRCLLRMRRRRLACPSHGVITEAVPFARPNAKFTRAFEDLVVWLTIRADKSTVAAFARVAWRTVGAVCQRVGADLLDEDRLAGLVDIGVDEISWRKHHKYLTLVSDAATGTIVWGTAGKTAEAFARFFADLPDGGAENIETVSMDLGPAYAKTLTEKAPTAVICYDPFHVVKVANDALDELRRRHWQAARTLPDQDLATMYKGARWALLKNQPDLTYTQAVTLATLRGHGGQVIRGHQLKETLRAVFADDLDPDQVQNLLSRWCTRASRSQIPEFARASRTIRTHRAGITAALHYGMNNGRHEALNAKARLIINRARGFHTANAALALILLACGPQQPALPYHTR